ncbi:MAG TPA: hypothetical protein DEV93_01460 [Chloroflexi bacterium]|nr:hypothetical protein [Chloroflexota bacterium]
MIQVEIAELKARLSEYLARVQAGEEIVVADRGGPLPASCLRNGADRARTLGSSISNAEDCCEWARECCPRNFGIWGVLRTRRARFYRLLKRTAPTDNRWLDQWVVTPAGNRCHILWYVLWYENIHRCRRTIGRPTRNPPPSGTGSRCPARGALARRPN